jgi:hypothetical protein
LRVFRIAADVIESRSTCLFDHYIRIPVHIYIYI